LRLLNKLLCRRKILLCWGQQKQRWEKEKNTKNKQTKKIYLRGLRLLNKLLCRRKIFVGWGKQPHACGKKMKRNGTQISKLKKKKTFCLIRMLPGRGKQKQSWETCRGRCFEGGPLTHGSWWGNIVHRKPPREGGFFRSNWSIKLLNCMSLSSRETLSLELKHDIGWLRWMGSFKL